VNGPGAAASSTIGSVDPEVANEIQSLRTGLELARASHLTMLRLQLALHNSNRRTAMQALDNLLEIDAELEELAATLNCMPINLANEAALFGFIGFQKEAIATEKHVLAHRDLRLEPQPVELPAADEQARGADVPAPPPVAADEADPAERAGGKRWRHIVAAAIVLVALGCALLATMSPALPVALSNLLGPIF